jgi:hypothetical protein
MPQLQMTPTDSDDAIGKAGYSGVKVKNTFIEAEDDAFNMELPWRRHATMPDTRGSGDMKSDECKPLARLEEETPKGEGSHPQQVGGGINDDIRKTLSEDFDWRRCTTGCSFDGFVENEELQRKPDTGGSGDMKSDKCIPLARLVEETPNGEGSHLQQIGVGITDDMRKTLVEDFDWRWCTTGCSFDGFVGNSYAMPSPFVAMPYYYPTPQLQMPPTDAKSNKAGRKTALGSAHPEWNDTVTTVMVRNLHNCINQRELLAELEVHGFGSAYDFLYLPIDTETKANRGYAFINFVSPGLAKKFRQQFEDGQIGEKKASKSGKFLKVSPATLQGLAANYAHYSTARVQRGPQEIRPLFLRKPTALESDPGGTTAKEKRSRNRSKRCSLIDMVVAEQIQVESSCDKFCHQCGGQVRPDFKFCISCGTPVAHDLQ